MSDIKDKIADKAVAIAYQGDAPLRASKLPRALQFPLVVILSLVSSALAYSFAAEYTAGELATVSRRLDAWWEVAALLGWRILELAFGWFGNYDSYDLVSLSILSHGPPLYLLGAFYKISPGTIVISLVIVCLATYLPFRLLRPLSFAHASSTSTRSVPVPNRDIVTDLPIQLLTATLAAGIYGVALYAAFRSYLSIALVKYFNDLPSIEAAHVATPLPLIPVTFIFGLAARSFIFTPAIAAPPTGLDGTSAASSLGISRWTRHVEHRLSDYSPRTRIVMKRTVTLMLITGINTFLHAYVTLQGVEAVGAAAYASVWVLAAFVSGYSLGVVGAV